MLASPQRAISLKMQIYQINDQEMQTLVDEQTQSNEIGQNLLSKLFLKLRQHKSQHRRQGLRNHHRPLLRTAAMKPTEKKATAVITVRENHPGRL